MAIDPLGSERILSPSVAPQAREEVTSTMPAAQSPFTFQIFIDFRGMYRWLLLDSAGHQVERSRHGFAGLAAAWRDAESTREREYVDARIDAPRLAG